MAREASAERRTASGSGQTAGQGASVQGRVKILHCQRGGEARLPRLIPPTTQTALIAMPSNRPPMTSEPFEKPCECWSTSNPTDAVADASRGGYTPSPSPVET